MTDIKYTKDNVKVGDVFTFISALVDQDSYEILYVGDALLFAKNLNPDAKQPELTFSYSYLTRYMVKKKKILKVEPKYIPVFKTSGSDIYLGGVAYTLIGKESPSWKKSTDLVDWIEVNYEKEIET